MRRPGPTLTAYLPVLATAGSLALLPLVIGDSRYLLSLAIRALVFAAYAVGFNLLFGASGQLFLCLGALAGVSAYGSAILGNLAGVPLPVSVLVGTLAATTIGGVLSWAAVRRGLGTIFLGVLTLTFSLAFTNLLLAGRGVTGGETGMLVTGGAGTWLRERSWAYLAFLAVLVGFLTLYRAVERSRLGWALWALRADPLAAELAGVDVTRSKVVAGVLGSAMLGLVGSLHAAHEGFVSPTGFAFAEVDVRVLVIVVLGGVGSLLGPVTGAATIAVVDELLRPLGQLRVTVYGVVLIALFLGFPGGLAGAARHLRRRLRRTRSDATLP